MEVTLAVFAHLLMFAYWLGGDIGAFIASQSLTNKTLSAEQRLTAARILNHVDMAPKTALIWSLPTGVWLGQTRGWIALDLTLLVALIGIALVWTIVLWRLHLSHGATWLTRLDLALRIALIAGLIATVIAAASGTLVLPGLIMAKLLILAAITALGLTVRVLVRPLGPALMALSGGAELDDANQTIASVMFKARLCVIAIWALLISATTLGILQ